VGTNHGQAEKQGEARLSDHQHERLWSCFLHASVPHAGWEQLLWGRDETSGMVTRAAAVLSSAAQQEHRKTLQLLCMARKTQPFILKVAICQFFQL